MATKKVYAPNREFSGSRRGVTFVQGVAEVDEDNLAYFAAAGYGIGGPAEPPAAQTDSRVATIPQQIGTPLRDAAVEPKPSDFLPPVNAGRDDPHGPNVVAPEIHHDGPKGIKPGDVFVHDLAQQERRESSLARAVLIEGQNATEAALEHYDEPTAAGGIDGLPKRNATKAAWVDYAAAHGVDRLEADDLSRDALAERFYAEQATSQQSTEVAGGGTDVPVNQPSTANAGAAGTEVITTGATEPTTTSGESGAPDTSATSTGGDQPSEAGAGSTEQQPEGGEQPQA